MKIRSVKVYLVNSGRLHPVIVRIDTDEGISGIGEAAIAYGLGGTAAAGMIKDLATLNFDRAGSARDRSAVV
ncbi:hypothetical protein LP415_07770 [Polaromonas sp. P1(28)-8]|nr:hypothetical protein LP415_07770 [Polaromonas sp. P1(28)-8]